MSCVRPILTEYETVERVNTLRSKLSVAVPVICARNTISRHRTPRQAHYIGRITALLQTHGHEAAKEQVPFSAWVRDSASGS